MSGLSRTPFCAALIAGGKSTRMGRDKRLIEFSGLPLWRRQIDILASLKPDELVISGEIDGPWKDSGHLIVPDTVANAGPLAGIAAVLATVHSPRVLALAVDMPHMTADFLLSLLKQCTSTQGIVPSRTQCYEPLAAVYPRDCAPLADNQLRTCNFSLQYFVRGCIRARMVREMEVSPENTRLFCNFNTSKDLSGSLL